ncbi:MAG: hypothetical protein AAF531_04780 [Actinomycetota bacterium]
MADEEQNPVDQLIDLFVYAPVGLLYEYQEVIPKLVKRGKSQVQLARVVGKMATNRGGGAEAATMVAEGLASMVTKQLTEIGEALGLAPPTGDDADREPPAPKLSLVEPPAGEPSSDRESSDEEPAGEIEAPVLPIARYDDLTAKEIIGLLDDLEPGQLDRVREHEESNRARKTVLGKLDRLAQ